MFDIENEVFTQVAKALRAKFPGIRVVGEAEWEPPKFPAVSFEETSHRPAERHMTQGAGVPHVDLSYTANIYSNLSAGRKAQCKAIAAEMDEVMRGMGFLCTTNRPIENIKDTTVARRVIRWSGTTDSKHVYRR